MSDDQFNVIVAALGLLVFSGAALVVMFFGRTRG